MSKYVKDLITSDLAKRLEGVNDAILVNVVGMSANNAARCGPGGGSLPVPFSPVINTGPSSLI